MDVGPEAVLVALFEPLEGVTRCLAVDAERPTIPPEAAAADEAVIPFDGAEVRWESVLCLSVDVGALGNVPVVVRGDEAVFSPAPPKPAGKLVGGTRLPSPVPPAASVAVVGSSGGEG